MKQFLYLVGGGILAVVCFMLPIPGIIKYPLSFLFGGVGAAVAFIPIEGRPMDVMLKNFLKALPAENQYIFKKRGAEALISEFFSAPVTTAATIQQNTQTKSDASALEAKRALLFQTLKQSYKPDEKEEAVLSTISTYLNESSRSASPSVQNVDSAPKNINPLIQVVTPASQASKPIDLVAAVKVVKPIQQAQETPVAKPSPNIQAVEAAPTAPQPPTQSSFQVPQEPTSTHITPTPAEAIATPSTPLTSTPAKPSQITSVTPNESQNVTSVAPESSLKAGFPHLPDTPNIVMGIIKDPRGKVLPNILVEIMDVQGIPVRAFKTNALGQFAAATPLPSGEYNVVLEDPRKQNEFEQIHITLDGTIFQPLEIISVDQREKLRRELFGGQTNAHTSI